MTNKHKHADMIIAKANNMDLVVFYFDSEDEEWRKCSFEMMINYDAPTECLLCLPKHEEAVLNRLNGGLSQYRRDANGWEDCSVSVSWSGKVWYMSENVVSRIKPRKEKRWIAVRNKDLYVEELAFETIDSAKVSCIPEFWSYHEIEVEV